MGSRTRSPSKAAAAAIPLTQPSGNGFIGYWCVISYFPFFFGGIFECLCRSSPQEKKPCPVTRAEFKDVYNSLIKHVDKNKFTADFWTAFRSIQSKMKDYQKPFKTRLAKILQRPFEIADAPKVIEKGIAIHGKKEL